MARIETPQLDLDPLLDANITFHDVLIQDDGQRTRELAGLLVEHALQPVISLQLAVAEAAEGHRVLEQRHPGGQAVLDVAG
ncbi:MAG TPA: hypothetical protein VMA72_21905 [Streptosporangiaceae bacterium]|nr:hypothetical protein [Streptosporangiaceae bacterium]